MLSEKGIINFLAFGILGLLSQGFSFQLSLSCGPIVCAGVGVNSL